MEYFFLGYMLMLRDAGSPDQKTLPFSLREQHLQPLRKYSLCIYQKCSKMLKSIFFDLFYFLQLYFLKLLYLKALSKAYFLNLLKMLKNAKKSIFFAYYSRTTFFNLLDLEALSRAQFLNLLKMLKNAKKEVFYAILCFWQYVNAKSFRLIRLKHTEHLQPLVFGVIKNAQKCYKTIIYAKLCSRVYVIAKLFRITGLKQTERSALIASEKI